METSTFGVGFIALRMSTEKIIAITNKLNKFGVELDGSSQVFCDKESVVNISKYPESTLNKKHLSYAYHNILENVSAETVLVF